jgi:hypothetical protein
VIATRSAIERPSRSSLVTTSTTPAPAWPPTTRALRTPSLRQQVRRRIRHKLPHPVTSQGERPDIKASWSFGVIRSSSRVLLDEVPDPRLARMVLQRLEVGGDKVADLHLWRLGPSHMGLIASFVTHDPLDPQSYNMVTSINRTSGPIPTESRPITTRRTSRGRSFSPSWKGGLTPPSEVSAENLLWERPHPAGRSPRRAELPKVMRQRLREQFPDLTEQDLDDIAKNHF